MFFGFFFPLWGYRSWSHALIMERPGYCVLLVVELNNCRHVVLQKSWMRTPGSWISRCGCWNRPIVCLHAGRGLGQTVPPFQDFKLKTGKKEGKGGSGLEWLQENFLSTGSAQLQGKGNALKRERERLAVLYELWSRTSVPQHSLPFCVHLGNIVMSPIEHTGVEQSEHVSDACRRGWGVACCSLHRHESQGLHIYSEGRWEEKMEMPEKQREGSCESRRNIPTHDEAAIILEAI